MILHLRNVLVKGQQPHFVEKMDATHLFKDRKDMMPVSLLDVNLLASADEGAVTVDGNLNMELDMTCSRCLSHTRQALNVPFHEVFVQSADDSALDEDDHVHAITEDKVELTPIIEENVLLALPFVPLCNEDCKGLCSMCGNNRNEAECHCKEETIDPRLARLAELLKTEQ